MNRHKIIRCVVAVCMFIGGIGLLSSNQLIPGAVLLLVGALFIVAVFKNMNKPDDSDRR